MFINDLSLIEFVYWAATIFGGGIFLIRMVMFMIGGNFFDTDIDGDFDLDIDIDSGFDGDGSHHMDADSSFKFLSVQGITAFFMMFGLVGLTLFTAGLHFLITLIGAVAAGIFTMWVIALIFKAATRLESDGTIELHNAIDQPGTVYLNIPPNGTGKVRLVIQGSLKVIDAIAEDKKKIPTGEDILVVDTLNSNTLVVKRS